MKVFHISDLHWSNAQLDEKVRCACQLLEYVHISSPDVIVVAGDSFDHSVKLEDAGTQRAIRFFNDLSQVAPVLVIKGNYSHDRNSIDVLNCCAGRHPIHVSTEPEIVLAGADQLHVLPLSETIEINAANASQAIFFALPYPTSSFLARRQAMGPEALRIGVSDAITEVMRAFAAIPSPAGVPRVLMYHGTVAGARISDTQHMMGMDIEIRPADIASCNFDLVCAGHLHYGQQIGDNVFYPGGMCYSSYGDVGDRGGWLHTFEVVANAVRRKSEFMPVQSIPMRVFSVDYVNEDFVVPPDWLTDRCHVLVKIKLREDDAWKERQREWRDLFINAVTLRFQRDIVPIGSVRCQAVREARNLADKVRSYFEYTGEPIDPALIEKARMLESMNVEDLCRREV